MRLTTMMILLISPILVACSSTADEAAGRAGDDAGEVDTQEDAKSTRTPEADAGRSGAGIDAIDSSRVDANALPDATSSPPDVTAWHDGVTEAQAPSDATTVPETSAPTVDAMPPRDAGTVEAATVDGGSVDVAAISDTTADAAPACPLPGPSCDAVNRAIDDIRRTFTKPCSPENDRKCGGVVDAYSLEAGQYSVQTLPLVCQSGAWTLAGVWAKTYWSPFFDCSKGCAANTLCAP